MCERNNKTLENQEGLVSCFALCRCCAHVLQKSSNKEMGVNIILRKEFLSREAVSQGVGVALGPPDRV